jgi:hypothetical protein
MLEFYDIRMVTGCSMVRGSWPGAVFGSSFYVYLFMFHSKFVVWRLSCPTWLK